MTKFAFSAAALAMTIATQATADQVIADDLIVSRGGVATLLCVGSDCVDPEPASSPFDGIVRIKANNTILQFIDTSTASFPDRDWKIQANDPTGAEEKFIIGDLTAGSEPFNIAGGAPTNAFFMASDGDVGFGTALPQRDLHVFRSSGNAALRLETVFGNWELDSGGTGLFFWDKDIGSYPLVLENDAPSESVWVNSIGNIGLGTQFPEGKLHTRGSGVQLAYLESSDGDAVQVRFRTDSQNRRFLAVNNANEVKSQIVFGDNQIQFLGETVAQEWLRISSAGIVSSGPTCNPNPCDRTFDPEYFEVPSIEERAAYMWKNMHLPAVGSTAADETFNVTEKLGGVIHELEVAHIYIEQLHERLVDKESRLQEESADKIALKTQVADLIERDADQTALIAELASRLSALEAQ